MRLPISFQYRLRRFATHLQNHTRVVRPRGWSGTISKRYAVHGAVLLLASVVAINSRVSQGATHSSLLYTLVAGEELTAGPLDPSAYAQTEAPGVGGARLAAVDSGVGVDIITFDDAEVGFSQTLGGSSVVAPLSPLPLGEPTEETTDTTVAAVPESRVYTVADGDTIAGIAEASGISVDTILWANGLSERTTLQPGDHLTILPVSGVLHPVKSGETLSAVAAKYDISADEIIEFNKLSEDGAKLSIGQKLIVPGGELAPAAAPNVVSSSTRIAAREPDGPTPEPVVVTGEGAIKPTAGDYSQYFRWGHTGVDIANRSRPAVHASLSGTVEFTGWLGGYGNLIIMNHGNGTQTYYAHLDKIYVSKGATVAKGAAIGQMGSTGRSTGPHLHFEYRQNGRPINPLGMF